MDDADPDLGPLRARFPTDCERKLKAEKDENARLRTENAQLQKQVADLKARLGPDPEPPAGPLPYKDPWGQGVGP